MRASALPRALAVVAFIILAATSAPALCACRVFNDTNYSFTVESGNTSNQVVTPHSHTTITPGKVIAKSREGKSFGGYCKDGEEVVVKEEKGVVMMLPR